MPRDWSKWKSPGSGEILPGPEDCEKLLSAGCGSRSSFTSVDSGFFSCEEDFREKAESLNAEKLKSWIKSVSDRRSSLSETPSEMCQACDGETVVPVCPYHADIEDHGGCEWDGRRDSQGRLDGRGFLTFPDGGSMLGVWHHGVRHGRFSTSCPHLGVKLILGDYQEGELAGPGQIVFTNDDILLVSFSQGSIHGLARRFSRAGETLWVGRFHWGKQSGICWKFVPGGGFITG